MNYNIAFEGPFSSLNRQGVKKQSLGAPDAMLPLSVQSGVRLIEVFKNRN